MTTLKSATLLIAAFAITGLSACSQKETPTTFETRDGPQTQNPAAFAPDGKLPTDGSTGPSAGSSAVITPQFPLVVIPATNVIIIDDV